MNLSYTLPKAEENILAGVKLHTLRKDPGKRWKPGLLIHHSYSFRSKGGYKCFLVNKCLSVQQVLLVIVKGRLHVRIDRYSLKAQEIEVFAFNDGFESVEDLIKWFFPKVEKRSIWAGTLIHWSPLSYPMNLIRFAQRNLEMKLKQIDKKNPPVIKFMNVSQLN